MYIEKKIFPFLVNLPILIFPILIYYTFYHYQGFEYFKPFNRKFSKILFYPPRTINKGNNFINCIKKVSLFRKMGKIKRDEILFSST